jgi:hypothetical protein
MIFLIRYDIEYKRTIPSVLIDSRATIPAIATKIGSVIKAFCDWETNMVTNSVLPYKIESYENGSLVGYFTIRMNGGQAFLLQYQLRPAFVQFNTEISQEINTFVQSNLWKNDYLF